MLIPSIMIGSALVVMLMYFNLSRRYYKALQVISLLDDMLRDLSKEAIAQEIKIKRLERSKHE